MMDKKISKQYDLIAPYFTRGELGMVLFRVSSELPLDDYVDEFIASMLDFYQADHGPLDDVIQVKEIKLLIKELRDRVAEPMVKQRFGHRG